MRKNSHPAAARTARRPSLTPRVPAAPRRSLRCPQGELERVFNTFSPPQKKKTSLPSCGPTEQLQLDADLMQTGGAHTKPARTGEEGRRQEASLRGGFWGPDNPTQQSRGGGGIRILYCSRNTVKILCYK